MYKTVLTNILILLLLLCSPVFAATYYIDSVSGSDSNLGTSALIPWKTVAKANAASCASPNTYYYKKNGVWREQVVPCSGTAGQYSKYTSYGNGNKPKFLGSIQLTNVSDWTNESGSLWYHAPDLTTTGTTKASSWGLYVNSPASASYSSTGSDNVTVSVTNGGVASDIQVYNSAVSVTVGKVYLISFRAKLSTGSSSLSWSFSKNASPWTWYHYHRTSMTTALTTSWQTFNILLRANVTASDAWFNSNIGVSVPSGTTLSVDTFSIKELSNQNVFYGDVGALVFNNEASVGQWKYTKPELAAQGDFWYDFNTWRLYLYSASNPASYYINIETIWDSVYGTLDAAGCNPGVLLNSVDYVDVDGLDIRYWPCGIGSQAFNNTTIRNNDISYIGGEQNGDGAGTRYGNGIEIKQSSALQNVIIEKNKIHDVWDSGIAKESHTKNVTNLYIRNNYVWNCGLAGLEITGTSDSVFSGFYVYNNSFYNAAGGVFGGTSGRTQGWPGSIAINNDTGSASNFKIKNNICYSNVTFNESTSNYKARALFVGGDANPNFKLIDMDYNLIFRDDISKELIYNYAVGYTGGSAGLGTYLGSDFSTYQSDKHKDQNSVSAGAHDVINWRNRGTNLSDVVTEDINGIARPQESITDIGAYEYIGGYYVK